MFQCFESRARCLKRGVIFDSGKKLIRGIPRLRPGAYDFVLATRLVFDCDSHDFRACICDCGCAGVHRCFFRTQVFR